MSAADSIGPLGPTSSARQSGALPSIALPKGGASVSGSGEKFQVNAASGTGSLIIPISTSPGRGGFGPEVVLAYDSSGSSGPFGLGWDLGIPNVTRKTSRGIPQYDDAGDSDVFLISDAQDLVPVFQTTDTGDIVYRGGKPAVHVEHREGFTIQRYAPRVESAFLRIERWIAKTGQIHWRVLAQGNVTSIYGRDESSRISCFRDGEEQTFTWLLAEQYDATGNAIIYEYKAEDAVGVPNSPSECSRSASRPVNRYVKCIHYGNRTPNRDANWRPFSASTLSSSDWMFTVAFDYGEFDDSLRESQPWTCRKDPFSTYRAGFEIRTRRLCRRIIMFHSFPELGDERYPVESTSFTYDETPSVTYLTGAQRIGHIVGPAGITSKAFPPVSFEYSRFPTDRELSQLHTLAFDSASLANLPSGVDGTAYQWLDLDGEGLPGVVFARDSSWFYKRNESLCGEPAFGPLERVAPIPSIPPAAGEAYLADVQQDGVADFLWMGRPTWGFFSRNRDSWSSFRNFDSIPRLPKDCDLKFLDLTGDGLADIVVSEDSSFLWFPCLGESGYGHGMRTTSLDQNLPHLLLDSGNHSLHLADMTGDGLHDLVRVRSGEVCYWPNLGYGRFGEAVPMGNAPLFAEHDVFNPKRILLADIDGSGTTDLLYLGSSGIDMYVNEAGNQFSIAKRLTGLPPLDAGSSIEAVDLLGNGTTCLVWTSRLPTHSAAIKYVDLMSGRKPHLLVRQINNCGMEIEMQYASSTKFYLTDKRAGRPWATRLPFPVHCVERVEILDRVANCRYVTRYAYHHGYYDGREREFGGFAAVEQWDTEHFDALQPAANVHTAWHTPPTHTKSWFHTGAFLVGNALASEYFSPGYLSPSYTPDLEYDALREAHRALKGKELRVELYANDGGPKSHVPYTISEHNYTVQRRQAADSHGHSVFVVFPQGSIVVSLERNVDNPRMSQCFILDVDRWGNALKTLSVAHGRQSSPLTVQDSAVQQRSLVTYTEADFTNAIDMPDNYSLPAHCESRTYEIHGWALPAPCAPPDKDAFRCLPNITFEAYGSSAQGKRLVERSRVFFRSDDLREQLPHGRQQSMAIVSQSFTLALTPGLLNIFSQGGALIPNPCEMLERGKYVDLDADGHWWAPSSKSFFSESEGPDELADARKNFWLTRRSVDIFGNSAFVEYDRHNLFPVRSQDALGNVSSCRYDYRVLQPYVVVDCNGNRSMCAFDEFGWVAASAVMGKEGERVGDTLDGFAPLQSEQLEHFFRNPRSAACKLLGNASTRSVYDVTRFWLSGLPVFFASISRTTHASEGPPKETPIVFEYHDGFGRTIQQKAQSDPSEVLPSPWLTSGWTIFNNKGLPVMKYEPFFDAGHDFAYGTTVGVSPMLVYDPLARVVATLNPNHTWNKSVFDAWHSYQYDVSDTVLSSPKADPDIGHLLRLPDADYLPTWYQRRRDGTLGPLEQAAAIKAAAHANTPAVTHLDALSRGRQREVFDAQDRLVVRRDYDMAGNLLCEASMEAATRWALFDASGTKMFDWDSRMHRIEHIFDQLRRPVESVLRANGREHVVERVVYGESLAAPNARGRIVRSYDQAGAVSFSGYDFKGNLVGSSRQLAEDYKSTLDWRGEVALEPTVFRSHTTYDAANRPVVACLPDGSNVLHRYNLMGQLVSLTAQIKGTEAVPFVRSAEYSAKGKLTAISYGNSTRTTHKYDPLTSLLTDLKTTRTDDAIQNIHYTYDPAGNIISIKDSTQQTIFFRNKRVDPSSDYTYDALHRLVEATGREHLSSAKPGTKSGDHANDGQAMGRYLETYFYDQVGNIEALRHSGDHDSQAWTRRYVYAEASLLQPDRKSNRLSRTSTGPSTQEYKYGGGAGLQGCITALPGLPFVQWDYRDQLRATARHQMDEGTPETTWYVYDSTGQRVRKVTERRAEPGQTPVRLKERLYVGVEIFRRFDGRGQCSFERETLPISDGSSTIALVETRTKGEESGPRQLLRYQLANHIDSVTLELDDQARILTYEEYTPYGSTSYKSAHMDVPKRYGYAAKEHDEESGLHYYGARYYASDIARWISCDPAGLADGLDVYVYVGCNPVMLTDPDG
ncbi:SpvB-domain-containing protein, partial [Trichodelitschia bisporula]